jgi:hypothetical protein
LSGKEGYYVTDNIKCEDGIGNKEILLAKLLKSGVQVTPLKASENGYFDVSDIDNEEIKETLD